MTTDDEVTRPPTTAPETIPETDTTAAAPRHRCHVIPTYLLQRLADNGSAESARIARETLAVQQALTVRREARTGLRPAGHHEGVPTGPGDRAGFVPRELRRHPPVEPRREPGEAGARAKETAGVDPAAAASARPQRRIHDAENGDTLPGVVRRAEGEAPHADESVNEAYDGLGATWALFHDVYGRDSLDDTGLPLVATVHFSTDYDNAFWDGEQMVFGDGDGQVFGSFTDAVDVIGHELAHGFTQYTAGFVYLGQSGALNEHVSDVFGVLTVQHANGQDANDADWLVGKGLFTDRVRGVALRSMKAPGTAYDDPVLGKDPQPATMADYRVLPHDELNDNGGVHINSGIPNHACYLAATTISGPAWESVGRVWYDVMVGAGLPKDATFGAFAQATIAAAEDRFGAGSRERDAIARAWQDVGVLDADEEPVPVPVAQAPPRRRERRAGTDKRDDDGGSRSDRAASR